MGFQTRSINHKFVMDILPILVKMHLTFLKDISKNLLPHSVVGELAFALPLALAFGRMWPLTALAIFLKPSTLLLKS